MTTLGTNALLLESQQAFDPQAGWQTTEVWAGSDSALSALSTTFAAIGCRVAYSNVGGRKTLHVTIGTPEPGEIEVPSDSFTIHKTFVQVPLWTSPKIASLVKAYAGRMNWTGEHAYEDALSYFQGQCETAFLGRTWDSASNEWTQTHAGPWRPSDLRTSFPADWTAADGGDTELMRIYKLMLLQGSTHGGFEIERPSLRRLRTYSAAYSQRVKMDLIPKVYSTSSLISAFSIPPLIAAQLPADPPASELPSNSAWGWKVRDDSTDIRWGGKFEERKEWVFWAWSTLLHEMV